LPCPQPVNADNLVIVQVGQLPGYRSHLSLHVQRPGIARTIVKTSPARQPCPRIQIPVPKTSMVTLISRNINGHRSKNHPRKASSHSFYSPPERPGGYQSTQFGIIPQHPLGYRDRDPRGIGSEKLVEHE